MDDERGLGVFQELSDRVPVAQVTNLTRALTALKKQGYAVVGLAADGDRSIDDMADVLSDAVVIVVGSEGEGLSRLVKETCDWVARIDMQTGNESLNASVAAAQTGALDDPFDAQLVQEIRQRMDSGSFQIDFNEVASNILREAIAGTQTARR